MYIWFLISLEFQASAEYYLQVNTRLTITVLSLVSISVPQTQPGKAELVMRKLSSLHRIAHKKLAQDLKHNK
jgi:hypothetical protein